MCSGSANCACGSSGPCRFIKLQEGRPGQQGIPGSAATIAVGTTTTLAAGEDATVDNSGTSSAAVLDFGIPRGDTGNNAYTIITVGWFMPSVGNNAGPLTVDNGEWFVDGQVVYAQTAGFMLVVSHTDTTVTLQNPGAPDNATPGAAIPDNSPISPAGYEGPAGDDGNNPFTLTTADFTQPAVSGTVTVSVLYGDWAALNQPIFVSGGGTYLVTATGSTSIQLQNTGATGNNPPGATIMSGAAVSPGGRPGDDGAAGAAGTAGHTPVLTSGTGSPSGGDDGDWYIQQVNGGKWQVYVKSGGFWSALVTGTITASRLLGFGSTDPNLVPGLVPNANDYYFTQIGSTNAIWVYSGGIWVVSNSWTSGGGGTATLPSAAAASTTISGIGQDMGAQTWAASRVTSWVPLTASHTVSGGTYQYPLEYPKVNLSLSEHVVLNINGYVGESEWRLQISNVSAFTRNITYSSGVWQSNQGVSVPTTITAGEVITLVFEKYDGMPTITNVLANPTPL